MFSTKFWLCTLIVAVLVVALDSAALRSVCTLSKPNTARVSCHGSDVKRQWFYKVDEKRCRPFITCSAVLDSQVEGGVNSFNSLAECLATCSDEHSVTSRAPNMPQRRSSAVQNDTRCPEPAQISNGVLLTLNDTVTYTCHEGFALVGEPVRNCLENGTWDSEEPRCDPVAVVKCPTPQPIDYMFGATVSCYTPGCTVNYTCQDRYTLVGDKGRVCNSSGEWIGTPICAKLVLLYNQTVYNDQQLELANGITKVHIECTMLPKFFPAGLQPHWEKLSNGALGEGSRDYWGPGLASYWLYFDKLLPEEHSGTYTCTAGALQASLKLKVLPATPAPPTRTPTLVSDIQNLTKPPGKVAQFTCIMRGVPLPQLMWTRNQQPITSSTSTMLLIQQNVSDTAMSIIIINSVTQSDAGTYLCTGTNSAGTTQASATLTVTGGKRRSVPESLSNNDGVEHLCRNSESPDTVTVVGRVRQHTSTSSGIEAYQVQISNVLSGTVQPNEEGLVTVVAVTPQLPQLRRGSKMVFQGTVIGSELYILHSDSVRVHSKQLEALLAQSC